MTIREDHENNLLADEQRRLESHEQVKASIDRDVNAQIKRESKKVEPAEEAELAGVARELKQKSVQDAVGTERELGRTRVVARISQVIDYVFYLIYGLVALHFALRLMGARRGNEFVQFIDSVTWPFLAPFEAIVPTPTAGAFQLELSALLALIVYILLHLAINGAFRLIAHRKVAV